MVSYAAQDTEIGTLRLIKSIKLPYIRKPGKIKQNYIAFMLWPAIPFLRTNTKGILTKE